MIDPLDGLYTLREYHNRLAVEHAQASTTLTEVINRLEAGEPANSIKATA